MDASDGSSPPRHSQNAPRRGRARGKGPAVEIRQGEDDFMFAQDTFPALPDFPCLSSPSSSTFSSSSSSNSSSAFAAPARAGGRAGEEVRGEPSEPAAAGDGMDDLSDIDHLLDFASINDDVPWDDEPLFPDVGMMLEDVISEQQPPAGRGAGGRTASDAAAGGGEDAFMGGGGSGTAADDLPRFFMEWLTNNRDCISAEDLRSIRLRRSTIEAAAARLGGGRQGTMQLLKLILTWVQNHHLQKKRPRVGAMDQEAPPAGGQLPSPGANPGYEFPAETGAAAATSWMPYQAFLPPAAYGGEAIHPFQPSCSKSSVVVSSQPFSPPAAADMHAGNMAWPLQYAAFVPVGAASAGTQTYPMPPPGPVPQPFAAPGLADGQFPQRMEPSATREARKKRMARQRRLSCLQQQRSQQLNLSQIQSGGFPQEPSPRAAHSAPVTLSPSGWGGHWSPPAVQGQLMVPNPLSTKSNSSRQKQQKPSPDSAARPPSGAGATQQRPGQAAASDKQRQQGARTAAAAAGDKNLRFLLQKVLKQSDVGTLGRIVLPKEAETHLPELKTGDGISIPIEDIGTSQVWSMRYRFWPNNKSRMYLLENTGDFVRSNELQEGDFIVLYSDVKSGKYKEAETHLPELKTGDGISIPIEDMTLTAFTFLTRSPHLPSPAFAATEVDTASFFCSLSLNCLHDRTRSIATSDMRHCLRVRVSRTVRYCYCFGSS